MQDFSVILIFSIQTNKKNKQNITKRFQEKDKKPPLGLFWHILPQFWTKNLFSCKKNQKKKQNEQILRKVQKDHSYTHLHAFCPNFGKTKNFNKNQHQGFKYSWFSRLIKNPRKIYLTDFKKKDNKSFLGQVLPSFVSFFVKLSWVIYEVMGYLEVHFSSF